MEFDITVRNYGPQSTSDSSQRYYDALAAEFRAQDEFWDNPYDQEIWRLEHALIRPYITDEGVVLDLGCGFYPHFEFAFGRKLVAGDISHESLRIARDVGDESGAVRLVQFDACALPLKPASVKYVIAGGELLNHLAHYPSLLDEVHRVLQPDGIFLVQVGAKWCFDSLWAIIDAFSGGHIGYAVTQGEAAGFFRRPGGDISVTWAITPNEKLRVHLLSIPKLRKAFEDAGFRVLNRYGANSISGLIPLPIQQTSRSKAVHWLLKGLIRLDRVFARLPIVRNFSGNVFVIAVPDTRRAVNLSS